MREILYDVLPYVLVILGFLAFIGILVLGIGVLENYTCGNQAAQMGFEHTWGFFKGCFIRTPEGWIDIERYRIGVD